MVLKYKVTIFDLKKALQASSVPKQNPTQNMVCRKMPSLNLKGVMQAETLIFTTTLSYLNKTAYIRLSSTCLSFNQALNRSLIIRKPDSLEQDL